MIVFIDTKAEMAAVVTILFYKYDKVYEYRSWEGIHI